MTAKRKAVLSGGCQCGAIRYEFYARPEKAHLCHCRMCQKAVGGVFGAFAPVRHRDFAWTKGRPREFHSSERAARGFCPACGTPLSFRYLTSDWYGITIGSLDDPAAVPPELHYGVESRVPWLDHLEGLTEHETQPGGITGNAE